MPSGIGGSMVSPRPLRSSSPLTQLRMRSRAISMDDLELDVMYYMAVSGFNFFIKNIERLLMFIILFASFFLKSSLHILDIISHLK